MKKCSKCNLSYDDDKKFCKKCGDPLTTEYQINPKEIAKKTVLEDRLKADPLNLELLHEYAQFLFNNLLFKETVTVSLKILALNEKDFAAQELVFKSYNKLKLYKDAYEIGEQLHAENPSDIFLLEELANLAKDLGNTEKAIIYYDKILSIKFTHSNALYNKALILLKKNELEEAIKIFKKIYPEMQQDQITSIYIGIDKALNSDFLGASKLLKHNLLDIVNNEDDINYDRGILFLAYSLCQTKEDSKEIYKLISYIDFDLLNKNYHLQEEQAIANTFLYLSELIYKKEFYSEIIKDIEYLVSTYLNKLNFTKNTNQIISEVWYNIGSKLSELELYEDSQSVMEKAIELNSNENKFTEKYVEIKRKLEVKSRKKKTKKIIGIVVTIIIIISCIVAIWTYLNFEDNKAFESAKKENTLDSYQYYLNNHPIGKYTIEAKAFWNKIRTANSLANVAKSNIKETVIQESNNQQSNNNSNANCKETGPLNSIDEVWFPDNIFKAGTNIKITVVGNSVKSNDGRILEPGVYNEKTSSDGQIPFIGNKNANAKVIVEWHNNTSESFESCTLKKGDSWFTDVTFAKGKEYTVIIQFASINLVNGNEFIELTPDHSPYNFKCQSDGSPAFVGINHLSKVTVRWKN